METVTIKTTYTFQEIIDYREDLQGSIFKVSVVPDDDEDVEEGEIVLVTDMERHPLISLNTGILWWTDNIEGYVFERNIDNYLVLITQEEMNKLERNEKNNI